METYRCGEWNAVIDFSLFFIAWMKIVKEIFYLPKIVRYRFPLWKSHPNHCLVCKYVFDKKNNFTAAITWEPHPPELFTWLLAPVWQKGARLHGGRPIKYLSNSLYSRFVVYFCCSYARLDHEVYQNDINNSHVQHLKTTSKKSGFFSIHSCLIRKSFNGIVSNECATR